MRIVGNRSVKPIQLHSSPFLFEEGCRFNDEMHKLPSGSRVCMAKGMYRYRSHEEANRHWEESLSGMMAEIKRAR